MLSKDDSITIIELFDKEEKHFADQIIYDDNMVQPAIHNWSGVYHSSLYDSTSDQRYVAYVSTECLDREAFVYMKEKNISAIGCNCDLEDCNEFYLTIRSQNELDSSIKAVHLTKKITSIFPKKPKQHHVYFLSISHDSKYVCISSFDKCVDGEYCAIYEVEEDKLSKSKKTLKVSNVGGYGAFLNNGCFVIVNERFLYMFSDNFNLQKCFSLQSLYQLTLEQIQDTKQDANDYISWCGLYNGGKAIDSDFMDKLHTFCYMVAKLKCGCLRGYDALGCLQTYVVEDRIRLLTVNDDVSSFSKSTLFYAVYSSQSEWFIFSSNKRDVAQSLMSAQPREATSYSLMSTGFSERERYFTCSAMIYDNRGSYFYSVYFEVWDISRGISIYCLKKKLKEVIPIKEWRHGWPLPLIAFKEQSQDQFKLSRPEMIATYAAMEEGVIRIHSFSIEFEKEVHLDRVTYSLDQRVQSHLLEPIGCARYFDDNELDGLHQLQVEESIEDLHFTVHISNRQEIYYSFKIQNQLYCIVIRADMLEVWTRNSINGTKYEDLSKRKINMMDQSLGDLFYDSEMIFVRSFKFPRDNLYTGDTGEFSIKNFSKLVAWKELPTIEELRDSIQIHQGGPSNGIIIRLFTHSLESDRIEDIYIPMVVPAITPVINCMKEWYHYYVFENACEALKYFHGSITGYELDLVEFDRAQSLSKRKGRRDLIIRIIRESLEYLADSESNYFVWMRASDILSLLASFPEGRDILFAIVQKESLSISLYNRLVPDDTTDKKAIGTSALTVLINELDFGLYKLLLNKIIKGAQESYGSPISICISDALALIQHQGHKDLLSKTICSLDFIPVSKAFELSEVDVEAYKRFDFSTEQGLIQDPDAFRNTFINTEQINSTSICCAKLKSYWYHATTQFYFGLGRFVSSKYRATDISPNVSSRAKSLTGNYIKFCIIPLSYFVSYIDRCSDMWSPYDNVQSHKESSLFISMATEDSRYNMFDEGNLVVALILWHKWKYFVKYRFIATYVLHIFFYTTYFLAVIFARERFGYIPGSTSISDSIPHLVSVVLFFSMSALLMFQEIRQYRSSRRNYLNSLYNYIDIMMLLMMVFTFFQMTFDLSYQNEVGSVCTLIVWLHGLLKLRAFMNFGIALEVVIRLFQKVFQIILFMILVVFAFTHAFVVLLRHEDDKYFKEEYEGTMTTYINGVETDSTVSLLGDGSNDFTNIFKSFKDVWFFIYGIWDPISKGESADNVMAMILSIVFSFLVLLLFFNIVIGFMSASIEEVLKHGRKAWLTHFRDVIVEIEQFWCSDLERRDYRNNPTRLYYAATEYEIRNQQKVLEEETRMLTKEYFDSLSDDSIYFDIVQDDS
ncbi:hypothetical protein BD560DRAFT_488685 [Blakeslea trispora]|nr:hypothetical protein BD560DRAFT_488685 [Blakeslea trispora]